MILQRSLYDESPPERRTRISNNPTLLYSWWCTIMSLVIIGFRLGGRYVRNERLFREDKTMAISIIPLMARMGCIHVVLIYGTNNVDIDGLVDPVKINHREIGSKVVLAARIFYAMFIWTAKFTVSEFLKRMTERFWKRGYETGLRAIRIFLAVTFVGVVIATLSECRPFSHHWQVVPDPGPQCRSGYGHLLTMGIADIITDVLLVCFPIPIIVRSGMPFKRKVSLVALFSMSIILIGITGARMPLVVHKRGLQQYRTVFASSEILAAATVSNAIILGSFLRDRGPKKAKYKAGSTVDSMDRRSSLRRPTLPGRDSDEDLARSLGYRTNPDLEDKKTILPRPAEVVDISLLSPHGHHPQLSNSQWQFPGRQSRVSQESGDSDMKSGLSEDPMPSPRAFGRRVSFFDVGGLLEGGQNTVSPSPTDSVFAQDFALQTRRTSRASSSIAPNARAHPPARRSSRLSQQSEDYETAVRPGQQLQGLRDFLLESDETPTTPRSPSTASTPRHVPARSRQPPVLNNERRATATSHSSVPSLQDAGGLLS
ncbi:hypothetical protein K458DRAFT_290536 [Lentithecium fluviatile CBS 122367]|uniref:Rhodopsin domain-containing protein n=1 Tax=Lentithecium fluviatile CBS 122367 TaxID=1168545 RepID=A0A6G1JHN5_9PLEO|nr:hypothetical protein K458DRAFT_290536 [Lentithecium fluviatile CBS 122367]